jgi:uncharacterized membrane protein YtjA (UPF0391 family)
MMHLALPPFGYPESICKRLRAKCRFCTSSGGNSSAGRPVAPQALISPVWACVCNLHLKGDLKMLWTICVILVILWALGMATAYTASGLIHILLVVAVVLMLIRLLQGRRIV